MRSQVLLVMGQDHLYKEEDSDFIDRQVHVVASTQELCHSTHNFVWVSGDWLVSYVPLGVYISMWPHHIYCYDHQYAKILSANAFFRAGLLDCIQKWVQVSLHSCNTFSIRNMETASILEFRELQRRGKTGYCIISTPIWMEFTAANEDCKGKSEVKSHEHGHEHSHSHSNSHSHSHSQSLNS